MSKGKSKKPTESNQPTTEGKMSEKGNFSLSCGDGILLPLVDQFS